MNRLDALIGFFSPAFALRRAQARTALAYYEGAEPTRLRNFYRSRGTQNQQVQQSAEALRTQARHLVQNHDISRGVLRTLVNNTVGASGVGIEPQPRMRDGSIHRELASQMRELYRDWCMAPEVTHRFTFPRLQRAVARTWLRDGECFGQFVQGTRPDLDHGTTVPMSLEVFEADMVPLYLDDPGSRVLQGIERDGWGRPTALRVYKTDPWSAQGARLSDTKSIPWGRVLHIASLDNISQLRGVSEFASVITRLEDIKDYEESERVAAKIAAMLTAYVRKGTPDAYEGRATGSEEDRRISLEAGEIITDLMPGEDIGLVDSKRPNPNLVAFRQGQLRAMSAGVGVSYSSSSKDYNGTYSAQRQELVEQWIHYAVLTDDFVGMFLQPVWCRFVDIAVTSGSLRVPAGVRRESLHDALFVAQSMPWIDPLKEAMASEALVNAGFESEVAVIRRRGGNPADVLEQVSGWREECAERGLVFTSNEAALQAARLAQSSAGVEG